MMPNNDKSDGIKMNAHDRDKDGDNDIRLREIEQLPDPTPEANMRRRLAELEIEVKQKDDRISQLTAMCYTFAKRIRNESFNDNITAVQRQQMAEMAMNSLQMTPQVWELIHKSEEAQQQSSS